MAVIGRTWTAADDAVADMLNKYKEETGTSFRSLERATGISYSRLRNISNHQQGTPTVAEYIALAFVTGNDPGKKMGELASIWSKDHRNRLELSQAARFQADSDQIMRNIRQGMYQLAASHDPNKEHEKTEDYN